MLSATARPHQAPAQESRPTSGRTGAIYAGLFYSLVTGLLFFNLLPVLGTQIYADLGDPLLNASILAWNAQTVPLSVEWWNFPTFAPLAGVTAWTEHLLGAYPLTTPVIWATGNAVLAYNLLMLVCFPLNGICAYGLVREVTGSSVAGFIGGLAFAFAPYQGVHLSHVQTLMQFGMPLALFGLHRYIHTNRRSALGWFAVGWVCVTFSNAYLIVFFPILFGLWCIWFLRGRGWTEWALIGGVALVALLPVVPLLWGYHLRQAAYGFERSLSEIQSQSADLASVIGVSHRTLLWRGLLPITFWEGSLFPGLAILTLTVVGVAASLRSTSSADRIRAVSSGRNAVAFYVGVAIVMWALALGPSPAWSGVPVLAHGPYWLLLQIPGVQAVRVPARAWLVAVLCLSVCAGAGMSWLTARFRRSWAIVGIATVAILSEGWFYEGTQPVPAPVFGTIVPTGAIVLDAPMYDGYRNAESQYLAVLGGYRVVNGYSGYTPSHFATLWQRLQSHQREAFDAYRLYWDLYVIVRPVAETTFVEWLEQQDGVEHLADENGWRVYRLPRFGSQPLPPLPISLPRNSRYGRQEFRIP